MPTRTHTVLASRRGAPDVRSQLDYMARPQNRDIIVIGASLGGVEALSALAGALPGDLPAAVLVVQHTTADSPGLLPGILARRGPLPATVARDGMAARPGRIHVAPAGLHLLLTPRGLRVLYGPRENRARPAIDVLFRTASVHYRSRVIGVVLTGLLSDGSAGLAAVRQCGGVALVQDPADAAHGQMPANALAAVPGARIVALEELPALLSRLCREPAPDPPPVPDVLRIEAELSERAMRDKTWSEVPGSSTDFTCPECRGALREIDDPDVRRYRCRVGHAFTAQDLLAGKDGSVEEAFWVALQTLQERTQMLETMARAESARGRASAAGDLEERLAESRQHVEALRGLLLRIGAADGQDVASTAAGRSG